MAITRGNALIRHYYPQCDLKTISDVEWAQRVSEATYLVRLQASTMAEEMDNRLTNHLVKLGYYKRIKNRSKK